MAEQPGGRDVQRPGGALRTGLAAGAGAGAAVGLMLALRRQHHQEIATVWTDRDATERRITELYTKAVEQLGSDKAPVRLGALYALERLAQDNRSQRPTIVNVICAYLRMPFSPTAPANRPISEVSEGAGEPASESETRTVTVGDTWQQERQVRLTAQRILTEHLRDDRATGQYSADPSGSRFWPDLSLDLTGAALIDFDLDHAVVVGARFSGATFSGDASFSGATFRGDARFEGTTFSGSAQFNQATFSRDAWFEGATFNGDAWFEGATFGGYVGFYEATFSGNAQFKLATFSSSAQFDHATFSGEVQFEEATFSGAAYLLSFSQARVLLRDAQHFWPMDGASARTTVADMRLSTRTATVILDSPVSDAALGKRRRLR